MILTFRSPIVFIDRVGQIWSVWKLIKGRHKIPLESSNLFELSELLHRHAENVNSAILQDQASR